MVQRERRYYLNLRRRFALWPLWSPLKVAQGPLGAPLRGVKKPPPVVHRGLEQTRPGRPY